MPCNTSDPTTIGVDFDAKTGQPVTLTVRALGENPPPVTVMYASYGGEDITATLRFAPKEKIHGLVLVPACPVDGQSAGVFEACASGEERLLKRFRFKASDPRRIFVVEGK